MHDSVISLFRGEYYFLSNFYPARLCFDGITYYSAENAYQAQKVENPSERIYFSEISADESKRYWEQHTPRQDWEQVKLSIMEAVVREKFMQNSFLAEYLVATGSTPLLEGNTWGDLYWGVDVRSGEGENHLGKILMELRQYFQKNGIPEGNGSSVWKHFGSVGGISAVFGDISQSACECIVSASCNKKLDKDGIDGNIRRAAGEELQTVCENLHGCTVSEAKITQGFQLKANYIIHTVGPCYGVQDDALLLKQCYKNILSLAREQKIHSIAMPVISVGRFSYPKKAAVQIALQAVSEWFQENKSYSLSVDFVTSDLKLYDIFCEHLNAYPL